MPVRPLEANENGTHARARLTVRVAPEPPIAPSVLPVRRPSGRGREHNELAGVGATFHVYPIESVPARAVDVASRSRVALQPARSRSRSSEGDPGSAE